MTDYNIIRDEQEGVIYIDLTPHKTKYAGIAVRQVAIDMSGVEILVSPLKQMILDFDADNRLLGIEII